MNESEMSDICPEEHHLNDLKETMFGVIQKSQKLRKNGFSPSYVSSEIIDAITDRVHRLEDSDENWLPGLPQREKLSGINGNTSYGRNMDIDWVRYVHLRSKNCTEEEREELRDIREILRVTVDPVAAWQWAYSYLVNIVCDQSTQSYPLFENTIFYNHHPVSMQNTEDDVPMF